MLDYRAYTFLEVCRQRSYTRAAEELHISQPAVSQHIRQLEQQYGCALFAKAGRGIEPTPAGEELFRALGAMANDEERLQRELGTLNENAAARAPLRFGCTRTVADYVAPCILAEHLACRPDDQILMQVENTAELLNQIETGTIDFALVEGSFDRARFDHVVFSCEPYVAIARHALDAARLEDLLGKRIILREPGSGTREILERYLAVRNLSVRDFAGIIELASIPAIKACVRAGAGISFLYRAAVESELAKGELADVTPADMSIEHHFELIWQRGSLFADRYRALARTWQAYASATA
ncbi:MAG TPA: LysR family transcriptional regulator [Collinsella ihuae]|uniref:LysR family transcriptional regulator n=1 Tax=Collinsella ihumii TaxID=1720204 RepID=A0A921LTV0_9ACTN|nr:LysR family transcriptional regulator [Collinsella ihumii]